MNSASVTRGHAYGDRKLAYAVFCNVGAVVEIWAAVSSGSWYILIGDFVCGLLFLGFGIRNLITWLAFRRGIWTIEWVGTKVCFVDRGEIDYQGDLSGLDRIDQDGRGYFLYTTSDTVFRLRRGRSSPELEATLDRIQAAQSAASDGDKRP